MRIQCFFTCCGNHTINRLTNMIDVTASKILIISVLVTAGPIKHSQNPISPWNHKVFPKDLEWLPASRYDHSDYEYEINTNNYEVCVTPECKKVAEEFLTSMNKSVDPCNDFYEFACGGWTTNNPIPPSSPNWSRFVIFENTVKHRIKEILESKMRRDDILPLRQAKKWYRSCMDTERLEQKGIEPIQSILMQTGGWPIAMEKNEWDEEVTWQSIDRHYAGLIGTYVFYELEGEYPDDDAEFGEINILPSELPLFEKIPATFRDYSNDDYGAYVSLLAEVVNLFIQHNQVVVSKKRLRKEIEELMEFEKEIDKLKQNIENSKFLYFNEFTMYNDSNMTEMSEDPQTRIDLKTMVEYLFAMVNIQVNQFTRVYLSNMAYIEGIPKLLKRTPLRTIVNYIHWKFVGNMLIYTNEKMRNKFLILMTEELYGVKERPPRWLECIDDMKMTHIAAYAFVDKFFTKSTESAGMKMVLNIRAELEANINNSNWLDEESKILVNEKLHAMKILLGFPDWYKNTTALIKYYKGLTIGTEYFDNILSNIRYEKKQKLKRYVIRNEKVAPWYMDPVTVNAMYGRDENVLNMPAVDFQPPLFTEGLSDAVNYGVVGVLIGHEMGHAFDDCAIRFGHEGNETKLSENVLNSYYERAECFVSQFNEYYDKTISPIQEPWNCKDEKNSEGERTAAENIADTTGLQAVFQAYKKAADKKSNAEKRLPGLEEFTDDQLFFISFADMWCEIETPIFAEITKGVKDVHSPARIRVIGAISNTKDFAEVFDCPIGSPMNPANKCDIWTKPSASPKLETGTERYQN